MKKKAIASTSAAYTFSLGKKLGEILEAGDVVALIGDLGTGKTSLTQGIARGLGVSEAYAVTSPTFTLINEYPGRHVLYHLDVYRLMNARDLEEMGYEEYFFGRGVTVIEWAEKILEILPESALMVNLTYVDENRRDLVLESRDDRAEAIIKALENGGF